MDAAGVLTRVIPSLIALALSTANFNRSVVIRGIESHTDLCPDFMNQWQHKDEEGNPDSFPCLGPGTTALTICQAAIALAASLMITSLISSNYLIRWFLGAWGILMFVAMLVYLVSYKKEVFKVEDALYKSSHKQLARHIGIVATLLVFICSLILAVLSVVIP
jgi:hypothetical protein